MKTYKQLYNTNNLKLMVDLTTYCNCGCPQCHRTNTNKPGLNKHDWIPSLQYNIDEFKKVISIAEMQHIKLILIGGSLGDGIMCKDIYEIIKYIIDNTNIHIELNTNGSLYPTDWWRTLGELTGKRLRVNFAINGLDQNTHNRYRRKSNLNIVLKNMKAFSDGGGLSGMRVIVFEYNKNDLVKIKEMCEKNGARFFDFVESNRFRTSNTFIFLDENGKSATLEKINGCYEYEDNVTKCE